VSTVESQATLFVSEAPSEELAFVEAELQGLFPDLDVHRVGYKGAGGPAFLQLVADLLTWSTVIKAAATIFLSQIAKNAADEVWKHKAELAAKLQDVTLKPLRRLVGALIGAKQRLNAGNSRVQVALPVPDDYWATILRIESTDEVEAAWLVASFVIHAEAIQATVEKLVSGGAVPLDYFVVKVMNEGHICVEWIDQNGELQKAAVHE
jgi:hypothetical protein